MPLGTEVGFGPDDIVLDGAQLPQNRGTAANFRPMSIVAKRSPISDILLSSCIRFCREMGILLRLILFGHLIS